MSNQLAEVYTLHALRFRRDFAHPVERVWRAITDERELTAWMGGHRGCRKHRLRDAERAFVRGCDAS
jgi:uncharacterized protein YndB with AHSA1/START domain